MLAVVAREAEKYRMPALPHPVGLHSATVALF